MASNSERTAALSDSQLGRNVMHFVRVLRAAGIPVGPAQTLLAVEAICAVGLRVRADFYWALHATLITRATEREVFDQAFHIFWRNPGLSEQMDSLGLPGAADAASPRAPVARRVADALARLAPQTVATVEAKSELQRDGSQTWSADEFLAVKDFDSMSAEELSAARAAIARMRFKQPRVRIRRRQVHTRGSVVDMRRTLQRVLRAGGAIDLVRTRQRTRPPPLVVLCDVSGSMSQYARMLLHFMHALTNDRDRVYTFAFGTRLTHLTRHLRERDVDLALARVGHEVVDWDGGTRIGACLHEFNRSWSRRVLATGTIVLLITDGLDRDAGSGLEHEMARLQRSVARVICLNPLLRYDGYEPRTQGIRAILPHVDEFLSIHNLRSMQTLIDALSGAHHGAKEVHEWRKMLD